MSATSSDWRDRFRQATVGFPSWSAERPDRLVFISNEGGTTQVWQTDLASGSRQPLTAQRVGVEEFVLSPDGAEAAWWSDDTGNGHGGWVATAVDGSSTRALLTGVGVGWAEGLSWVDGVVALALTDGTAYRVYVGAPGESGRLVAESAKPLGIGREWETTPGGLSTDGSLLCLRTTEHGDMLHFSLAVLDVGSGQPRAELVDEGLSLRVAQWSPVAGDQRLALIHELDGWDRPAVWNPTTGERRNYSIEVPGEIDVVDWYLDASALLLTHWHEGRSQLYRLDLDSGAYTLVHDPEGYVSAAGVRPDGTVWLREESGTRAASTRAIDGTPVLEPPGSSLPGVPCRSLRFEGPSGQPTHMLLTAPDQPAPYPVVMLVHGGPEWADPDAYNPWVAALVDHGVGVARVNYRGSTGFGVAWRTAIHDGNIGIPEVTDVVAGLGYLIDLGLADPQRCALEGWSWGGYIATLAAGLHPDVFAAITAGIPVCDSVMTHEDCSPSQRAYDQAVMGGSPAEVPERYAERSPSTYLDRVRSPMLLIAGEHDSACPIRQVRWYADQLGERGRSVRLHVYDAGHHANSVEERIRQAELQLEFLAEHGVLTPRE